MARKARRAYQKRAILLSSMLAAIGLCALVGPFGTYAVLPFSQRLLYWAAVAVFSVTFASFAGRAVHAPFGGAGWPYWIGLCVQAGVTSLMIAAFVDAVNLGIWGASPTDFPTYGSYVRIIWPTVFLITSMITLVRRWNTTSDETGPRAPRAKPPDPPFLSRIPANLGDRLLWLKMQDHYIQVVTEKGEHLMFLRFSDAMEELSGYDGMQIHRSYWVARRAVRGVRRQGRRMFLRLPDGSDLPVSRRYAAAVLAWLGASQDHTRSISTTTECKPRFPSSDQEQTRREPPSANK